MSISFNTTNIDKVVYNNVELDKVTCNGVIIFEKTSKLWNYPSDYTFLGSDEVYYFFYSMSKGSYITVYKNDKSYSDTCTYNDKTLLNLTPSMLASPIDDLYVAYDNWSLSDVETNTLKKCSILKLMDGDYDFIYPFVINEDILNFFYRTYTQPEIQLDDVSIIGIYSDFKENKIIIKINIDYYYDMSVGEDSWTEYHSDSIYLFGDDSSFTYKYYKDTYYSTDEPSSEYTSATQMYYNPYTKLVYNYIKSTDSAGDVNYTATAGDYTYSDSFIQEIKSKNIFAYAKFSIKDTDITISYNENQSGNTFTINVFRGNKEKIVTSKITSTEHPELIASKNNAIRLFYDGSNILFINRALNIITPLNLNIKDMTITV